MLCILVLASACPPARAGADGVQALTPAEAEQERMRRIQQAAPQPYVDKVMSPSELPRESADGSGAPGDEGDFRSWYSESRMVRSGGSGDSLSLRTSRELGQRVGYRRETLNYGDFELLADVRGSNGVDPANSGPTRATGRTRSGLFTLRNVAFPVTTRTFADSTAGDTFSEVTDALSRNYRLSLGTRPVRGLTTRVHSSDLDVRAGTGRRGDLLGGPFPGFEPTTGTLGWLGASRRTSLGTFGLQVDQASGRSTAFDGSTGDESVRSAALAWRHATELTPGLGLASRVTSVHSSTRSPLAGESGNANGWFGEASLTSDNARQEFGLFKADPRLRFADARIYDARGAYWRIDAVRTHLGWGLGAQVDDEVGDAARPSARRYALQANAQYQIDRRQSAGLSINVDQRRYGGSPASEVRRPASRSLYASGFYQRQAIRGGRSRFLFTVRRNQELVVNGSAATGEELSWEQEWLQGMSPTAGAAVTTTLGIARDREGGNSRLTPTAGVQAAYTIAPGWNVSANLRYTSTRSNLSVTQGLSGYFDTDYALNNGWRIGGSLTLNQVASRVDAPALLPATGPQLVRTHDSYLMLWARYETSGGSTARGIGGDPRAVGGGALQGTVFFDENRDSEQQSQEHGVGGVEVILDGRFRTTTDNSGRFVFPLVTTGPHRVDVRQESVPLPWGAADQRGWSADVPLRGEARVRVPVVKVGE